MSGVFQSIYPDLAVNKSNNFVCGNCGENQPFLYRCEECDQSLCSKCDSVFHKNKRFSHHERQRISDGIKDEERKGQVKEFRKIMFGEPAQEVEDTEFVICGDKMFTPETLQVFFNECQTSPNNSLLKYLIAEIRDACRLKEEFSKVLCLTKNIGCLQNASTNDFIICLLDATKNVSQKQTIFECLTRFDHPVVLGHRFCGLNSKPFNTYGLHLSELNHLIYCNLVEDESVENVKHSIILSIGTEGSYEKTKFLNAIWKTKFEKRSQYNGFHHDGQLELAIATESSKRNQHILDVHGNIETFPVFILQSLLNCADLILLHCNQFDFSFKQTKLSFECHSVIQNAINSNSSAIIVLVFHCTEEKVGSNFEADMKHILSLNFGAQILNQVSIFVLTNNWQDDKKIIYTHQAIASMLSNVSYSNNALKKIFDCLNSVPNSETDSFYLKKTTLPQNIDSIRLASRKMVYIAGETCSVWFPLSNNSTQIATLDDKQYEGLNIDNRLKLEMDILRRQRSKNISAPVKFFRDEISNKDNFDETSLTFTLFQQELSNKFQPIVSKYRKEIKNLKDELSKKSLKDQKDRLQSTSEKLIANDIAGVHFVRELVERDTDGIDENAGKSAVNICQSELLIGRSIEIVNGDSLTVATSFLQKVFDPIFQMFFNNKQGTEAVVVSKGVRSRIQAIMDRLKLQHKNSNPIKQAEYLANFVSMTVIGVESSGKSTLWNELWNSNFPVAHGKCSRGFWTSMIQVKNGPFLLVNDTEGILSPLCTKPRFDQKLVLLAFALSNIVIINVRGEGDNVLINLLKLVVYAAHKLCLFHRPHIVFVHRDVMGQREHEQGSFKNNLLLQLREACETIEQSGDKIDLDTIINTSQIHSFDLPSAIVEPHLDIAGQEVNKEERTAEFIMRCRDLRQSLIHMARSIAKDESQQIMKGVGGDFGWISFANHMWELAKQNASLWTFSSVNEKLQRSYIEKELDHLIHRLIFVDLKMKAKDFVNAILKDTTDILNQNTEFSNYGSYLTQLELEYTAQMEKELKETIHNFPGTTIPAEIIAEYVGKSKRFVSDAIEDQKQMFSKRLQDLRIKDNIKQKFDEISKKIENMEKSYNEKEVENSFNEFVVQAKNQIVALHRQRGIGELQLKVNVLYCYLSPQLKHPFPTEFINSHRDINNCHKTIASIFNKKYFKNVSNRTTNVLNKADQNDFEIQPPEWASFIGSYSTTISHSKPVVILLYKLQDAVYQSLWVENMKNFEKVANDWEQIVTSLCLMVDRYADQLYDDNSKVKSLFGSYTSSDKKQQKNYSQGYLQSVTNLMHTFANAMLMYFLCYQHDLNIGNEIQKFDEYCKERKKEVILRARMAQNASDVAKTTADQIIYKMTTGVNHVALEDLKQSLLNWEIHPEDVINDAVSVSYHEKNADRTFAYITKPIGFLKDVFKQRFQSKIKQIADHVQVEYFDTENSQSYINKKYNELQNALNKWHESVDNNMSANDAMNTLFQIFDENNLTFLLEIKDSVLKYLDNSTKNFDVNNIDHKHFAVELQTLVYKSSCHDQKIDFEISSAIFDELFEECWPKARGCEKVCPYCSEKCCGGYAHVKHSCSHHLLQAFTGWRSKTTQNPTLRICSDPLNFKEFNYEKPSYDTNEDVPKYIPFEDHIRNYHKDWIIVPQENKLVDDEVKIAWMMLRDRLATHFKYNTTTPPEWEQMYARYLKEK